MRKIRPRWKNILDSIIVKGICLIAIWVICLIPLFLGLFIWWLIGPETEIARIILGSVLAVVMGGSQILFGVFGAFISVGILVEDL